MRSRVGNRLPTFSKSQATLLKASLDFVGINHYTTLYVYNVAVSLHDYIEDSGVLTLRKFKLNSLLFLLLFHDLLFGCISLM